MSPSQDPPQDVAPAEIRRIDAVGYREREGPYVIGDHAVWRALGPLRVGGAGDPLGFPDQRHEEIGVIVGIDSLENGQYPLEAHSRVDVFAGKRFQASVFLPVVLHEDQVPELKKALAFHGGVLLRWVHVFPEVVMNLRTGATGALSPHFPEIVLFAEPQNPRRIHPHLVLPDIKGLVVIPVNGYPEPLLRKPVDLGYELPGPHYGLFFEIVAEGEIAEHLEEGVMPPRVPHVVEVVVFSSRPHTFLDRRGPFEGRRDDSEEVRLELVHPGVCEQERRISLREQGRGGNDLVIALPEELEKGLSGLIGGPLHVAYYAVNQGVISRNPCDRRPLDPGLWGRYLFKRGFYDTPRRMERKVVKRILLRKWDFEFPR